MDRLNLMLIAVKRKRLPQARDRPHKRIINFHERFVVFMSEGTWNLEEVACPLPKQSSRLYMYMYIYIYIRAHIHFEEVAMTPCIRNQKHVFRLSVSQLRRGTSTRWGTGTEVFSKRRGEQGVREACPHPMMVARTFAVCTL